MATLLITETTTLPGPDVWSWQVVAQSRACAECRRRRKVGILQRVGDADPVSKSVCRECIDALVGGGAPSGQGAGRSG